MCGHGTSRRAGRPLESTYALANRPRGSEITRFERAFRRRLARHALWVSVRRPVGAVALASVLAAVGALLHAPSYMLTHPFWLDEAWVADSLRAPLGDLERLTSSSPIGFTFLLRLVPTGLGDERARLVPLLFTAALCPLAYWLGRELDPDRRLPRWMLAFAAAVLPAAMLRHDLKQYTADAFVAVLVVYLAARAERVRTRRAVALLAGLASLGLLVSHTAAMAGAAVFAGLLAAHATRRAWRRVAETAVGATAFVIAAVLDYLTLGRDALTPALADYWERYYVPASGGAEFVGSRAYAVAPDAGLGPLWLLVTLLAAGAVALWLRGRRSVAIAVPVLLAGCVVASRLRLYPLWERRTSLFLFAVVTLVAAYGVAAAASRLRVAGAVPALAFAVVLGYAAHAQNDPLPDGDTRTVARLVAERRAPGDLVVVDQRLSYGFAYYWPGAPIFETDDRVAVGFVPRYPPSSGVVVGLGGFVSVHTYLTQSPTGTAWLLLSSGEPRYKAFLAEAERLGSVEVFTDRHDYYVLRVTRG